MTQLERFDETHPHGRFLHAGACDVLACNVGQLAERMFLRLTEKA
jgi:hypothetical protein